MVHKLNSSRRRIKNGSRQEWKPQTYGTTRACVTSGASRGQPKLEPHGLDGQHERLWELRLGNGGLCGRVQGKRAFSGIID